MSYLLTAELPQCLLTLVNGDNHNILPDTLHASISGPTATFNVTGIQRGADGLLLVLLNNTPHDMVLQDQNTGSAIGNRIYTGSGADETVNSHALLIYDVSNVRWQLLSHA